MPNADVKIPHPQPKEVPGPVPGQENRDLVESLQSPELFRTAAVESQGGSQGSVPAGAPPAAGAAPSPEGSGPMAPKPEDTLARLESAQGASGAPNPEDTMAKLEQDQKNPQVTEDGPGAPLTAEVVAHLGNSAREKRDLLQKMLGTGFETAVKDGEVIFRKNGDEKFQPMDPKFFSSLKGFLKHTAANLGGSAPDIVIQALAEGLGARLGGGPGMAAGAAVGGVAQAGVHQEVLNAFDVKPDMSLGKEATFDALVNVGTLGAATLARKPLGNLVEALKNSVPTRVRSLAKIRESVEEFSQHLGITSPPDAKLGKGVTSAVDELDKSLGERLDAVKETAKSVAGDKPVPVTGFLEKIRSVLEPYVEFNEQTGLAKVKGKVYQSHIDAESGLATKVEVGDETPFYALGSKEGKSALKLLVNDYNRAQSNMGGMKVQDLLDTLSAYGKPAGYDKVLPTSLNNVFMGIRSSLKEDRNAAFTQLLKGTPEEEFATTAFANYADRADAIKEFSRLAEKDPVKFAESLIAPKESERVAHLQYLLGKDSPAFGSVRSSWLAGLLDKSIDKESGVFFGRALQKELDRFGPDVVNQLLEPAQQNALKMLIARSNKVPVADLFAGKEGSLNFLRALVPNIESTASRVRTVLSLFKNDREMLQYLSNDGLLELAKQTKDPAGRSAWLQSADWIRKVLTFETPVAGKAGKRVRLPLEAPVLSSLIEASTRKSDEDPVSFSQRRQSSLDDVRAQLGGEP